MKLTLLMEQAHTNYLKQLYRPPEDSHKGQNGKVLIIGGSSLFHSASIWAADVASHLNDMVHYSSTEENNEIMKSLKGKFTNGIVVSQHDIPAYVEEDDAILVGPGMVRTEETSELQSANWEDVLKTENEALRTRNMVHFLIRNFPKKRFVFDAGALQMLDPEWLSQLEQPAIITPHQLEFQRVFDIAIADKTLEEKKEVVKSTAAKYKTVILLKAVVDIISEGEQTVVIEGGNPGLTKGGTGDVLGGTTVSFYTKNDPMVSAVSGSILLKTTADELYKTKGTWYNVDDLIDKMPEVLKQLLS